MMIEVVVSPAAGVGIALGILDGHVGAIEVSWEIAPSRGLLPRAIRVLRRQCQLQLLEEDRPFRKYIGLLVYLVSSRFDVDVVEFGKICHAAVQLFRRQR